MVVNTSAVGIAGVGGGLSVDRCPLGFLFHGVSGSAVLFSVGQTRERNHGVVSEQAAPAPQPGWRAEVWLSGPSLPLLGRGAGIGSMASTVGLRAALCGPDGPVPRADPQPSSYRPGGGGSLHTDQRPAVSVQDGELLLRLTELCGELLPV